MDIVVTCSNIPNARAQDLPDEEAGLGAPLALLHLCPGRVKPCGKGRPPSPPQPSWCRPAAKGD